MKANMKHLMKPLFLSHITMVMILAIPMISLAGSSESESAILKDSASKDSILRDSIPTVDSVDLNSYVGLWYENYRIENKFQDSEPSPGDGPCLNTTAEYSFLPKGTIGVQNTCYRQSGVEVAKAKAKVVRGSNNAKLKVNFTGVPFLEWFGIGSGDYWILALGEKNEKNLYSWALVGSPDLKYGWILSRTPDLAEVEVERALSVAEAVGYDTELFKSFRR